jgi:hypothetical protein
VCSQVWDLGLQEKVESLATYQLADGHWRVVAGCLTKLMIFDPEAGTLVHEVRTLGFREDLRSSPAMHRCLYAPPSHLMCIISGIESTERPKSPPEISGVWLSYIDRGECVGGG